MSPELMWNIDVGFSIVIGAVTSIILSPRLSWRIPRVNISFRKFGFNFTQICMPVLKCYYEPIFEPIFQAPPHFLQITSLQVGFFNIDISRRILI